MYYSKDKMVSWSMGRSKPDERTKISREKISLSNSTETYKDQLF